MKHVVMFSGGIGSWGAARRVAAKHGTDDLVLLFTDTNIEDPDLYRFLREAAADVGGELVWLDNGGKTPWDVFEDVRMLGNTRIAACSHKLKQEPARAWVNEHCDPDDTTLYVGIDWSEAHRMKAVLRGWAPYTVEAPLCEPPLRAKAALFADLTDTGIETPLLYKLGMPHNNCGGGCVKAGQAHFKKLRQVLPERFDEWVANEQRLRDFLGRDDIAILRDRAGGKTSPLTLAELGARAVIEESMGDQLSLIDNDEWGGCGCFVDEDAA